LDRPGLLESEGSPKRGRGEEGSKRYEQCEFKSFFLTMGDYDIVAIYEAPDDAVAARSTCSWACWDMFGAHAESVLKQLIGKSSARWLVGQRCAHESHGLSDSGAPRISLSAIESFDLRSRLAKLSLVGLREHIPYWPMETVGMRQSLFSCSEPESSQSSLGTLRSGFGEKIFVQ